MFFLTNHYRVLSRVLPRLPYTHLSPPSLPRNSFHIFAIDIPLLSLPLRKHRRPAEANGFGFARDHRSSQRQQLHGRRRRRARRRWGFARGEGEGLSAVKVSGFARGEGEGVCARRQRRFPSESIFSRDEGGIGGQFRCSRSSYASGMG